MTLTDAQRVILLTLWRDGATLDDIAGNFHVSKSTAYREVLKMGFTVKRPPVGSFWTTEKLTYLRDNWATRTGKEIGDQLGCSRSAVIGKAHREGLSTPPDKLRTSFMAGGSKREGPPRKRVLNPKTVVAPKWRLRQQAIARADTEIRGFIVDDNRVGISIMQLTSKTCKAVLNGLDAKGLATYCGYPAEPEGSFCETHAAIYYLPPGQRRA